MKIAYVYSGERENRWTGLINVDYPDTPFFGENHLEKIQGLEVDYKEQSDFIKSHFIRKILGFRIMHSLAYFFTLNYDVVIGATLFYALILKKIFRTKTRYVFLNISLMRFVRSKKSRIARWFVGWIFDEAYAIICLSQFQRNAFIQALPSYKGKIVVIPLGVDDIFYTPHYEERGDFILAAGRDNGRDYKTVIEVASKLPQRKFVLVCSKRNLVGIKEIPQNVTVIYDAQIQKLCELYYSAKLILLVTHDDSFDDGSDCSGQTVLLDAMASGLPVIASRKKYIHEYVKDGEDALLVNFHDVDDILKKIHILDDSPRALQMARSARARVELEFSTRRMAENIQRLLIDMAKLPK